MENRDEGPLILFCNCSILRRHKLEQDDLWVLGSKIVDPEKLYYEQKLVPDKIIDCNGALISPGFIDVQINGGFGGNFAFATERIEETIRNVTKGVLAHGVTAICPTVVSSQPEIYHQVLPRLRRQEGGCHGASILGAHVEGPFINPEKRGAHVICDIQTIENGMESIMETYGSLDSIAIVTLAPELDGAISLCKELTKRGIVVSLGHCMASDHDGERAIQNGASFITHLYNAMPTFQNGDPGLLGLLTLPLTTTQNLYYSLIADGHHIHPYTTRLAYKLNPKGVILVTDATSVLGLSNGIHKVGAQTVQISGTKVVLEGTDILVGGCAPLIDCVKYFWETTGCPLTDALEAVTLHPAKLLKIEQNKGTLDFGCDADLTILESRQLKVISTWIGGKCVYENPCLNLNVS